MLAALLRWQCIARAAKENPCASRSNHHWTFALGAGDAGLRGHVRAHAVIFIFSITNLLAKPFIKGVKQLLPVEFAIGNFIQTLFHGSGKAVIHQISKALRQAVSHNVADLFSKNSLVLNTHIAAILNRGNNTGVC